MAPRIEPVGMRFGRLKVLAEVTPIIEASGRSRRAVMVECRCGNTKVLALWVLQSRQTRSCGCLHTEKVTRHGEAKPKTPEYRVWSDMISRCENPKTRHYDYYGGRGITVCARWRQSYSAFLDDMGRRPSSAHSIDRYPDNDGNYEPGNCRWATAKEQAQNKRKRKS